jgi:GAF domain-containing protein
MAFTADELRAFLRALAQDAEATAQLARLLAEHYLRELRDEIRGLAEAQRRTEGALVAFKEAAEARFARIEAALEALAEAQRRTEERIGRLVDDVGVTAEVEATEVLLEVLEGRAYAVVGEPGPVGLDGEVDVAVQVRDAEGRPLTVLVEAKNRLYPRDVTAWANRVASEGFRVRLAGAGLPGPYLVYAFGRRVYPGVREAAEEAGIGVLGPRGEQVAPRPRQG